MGATDMRQLRGSKVTPVLSQLPVPHLCAPFLPAPPSRDYSQARPSGLQWAEQEQKGSGMRPFQLDSDMKSFTGAFYPTGWMVLMFAGEQQAREAARLLASAGISEQHLMLVTPEDFRREIAHTKGDEGILPSAGTEGDTIRKMAELFGQGHHGLMVHAPSHDDSDRVMAVLRDLPMSFGQKYRKLVIEDIVE
jgi:hypothetical protein